MSALYSDNDRHAAAWLRELIKDGQIPDGTVDERDIQDLRASDLQSYRQVHLFAGIGGWAYALHVAGWPADRPVWTGSCPCQPWSAAGKGEGEKDARHLWPVFLRLIRECHPPTVFGEQVASRAGREWLARVRDDLEAAGYAVGCADLPACSQGAPHKRNRLFWVADATNLLRQDERVGDESAGQHVGSVAGASGRVRRRPNAQRGGTASARDGGAAGTGCLGDADGAGLSAPEREDVRRAGRRKEGRTASKPSGAPLGGMDDATLPTRARRRHRQRVELRGNFWANADLIPCRDGKARRVEPGTFPLAHGLPGRVGLLRGYGNAIVPQVAAAFVRAFLECEE